MSGDTLRAAKAAKMRELATKPSRRSVGVVVSVTSPTQAQVNLGEKTVPVVVPASITGVVVDASVVVRLGGTPVVESVLSGAAVAGTGWTTLPGGVLFCYAKKTVTSPTPNVWSGVTWTFPMPFASVPVIGVTPQTGVETVLVVSFDSPGTTSTQVGLVRANNTDTILHVTAIGPAA